MVAYDRTLAGFALILSSLGLTILARLFDDGEVLRCTRVANRRGLPTRLNSDHGRVLRVLVDWLHFNQARGVRLVIKKAVKVALSHAGLVISDGERLHTLPPSSMAGGLFEALFLTHRLVLIYLKSSNVWRHVYEWS